MTHSTIALSPSSLEKFPEDKLAFLLHAVARGKNIHIQSESEQGRGMLVRLLTSQLAWDDNIIIVDEADRKYVSYDDSSQSITEIHSSLVLNDPTWVILRPRPSAVVINGDNVLKPQGRAYDVYSGIPYTETQIGTSMTQCYGVWHLPRCRLFQQELGQSLR